MEKQSLPGFLASDTLRELMTRMKRGEMDKLVQEDIESVKDIMSKEVRKRTQQQQQQRSQRFQAIRSMH